MQRTLPELDAESAELFDHKQIRDYLVFLAGSIRRHKSLAGCVFLTILLGAVAILQVVPKTYHSEAKVLAQRNPALSVRNENPGTDGPTRAAVETVLRRDNLIAIIQETDLLRHWEEHRSPVLRQKDALVRLFSGPQTEADRLDTMVETLEKKMKVWNDDGTVSIAVDWPDAYMAHRLVDAAQQHFLEARYTQEITALGETVAILKGHAASMQQDIDTAVGAVKTLLDEKNGKAAGSAKDASKEASKEASKDDAKEAPKASAPVVVRRAAPDSDGDKGEKRAASAEAGPDLAKLRATIEAKQRALADLEEARRRRLSELQVQLSEQRAVYTDNHPTIVDLQQTIQSLSRESPQIRALSQEVATLQGQLKDGSRSASAGSSDAAPAVVRHYSGGGGGSARASGGSAPPISSEILRLDRDLREDRDPAMVYARGQLRDAMDKYATLRTQLQAAQIDMETAQAAFRYRYSVSTPAQIPKKPIKPSVPLVLIAAALGGILAAMVTAVVADIRAARLLERWQIERMLEQPVLCEIELPAHPLGELRALPRSTGT